MDHSSLILYVCLFVCSLFFRFRFRLGFSCLVVGKSNGNLVDNLVFFVFHSFEWWWWWPNIRLSLNGYRITTTTANNKNRSTNFLDTHTYHIIFDAFLHRYGWMDEWLVGWLVSWFSLGKSIYPHAKRMFFFLLLFCYSVWNYPKSSSIVDK